MTLGSSSFLDLGMTPCDLELFLGGWVVGLQHEDHLASN